MDIENVPIGELVLDPDNANEHSEESIKAIMASLKEFGQQRTIVVDDAGVVRAGNGVLLAAMRLCWREIWVNRTKLGGPKLTAYAIADNRVASFSSLDQGRVLEQLRAIEVDNEALLGADLGEDGQASLDHLASQDVAKLLSATGFSESDRKAMERAAGAQSNVFGGSAGKKSADKSAGSGSSDKSRYLVIVSCSTVESQNATYAALQNSGYEVEKAST